MPIENNLIKATNRIAQAIEDKIAEITVASAIPDVVINTDAIVEAINNLQIGGGTGGSGSMDCNCLAVALKPIVQAIVDLRKDMICVIAPIAGQITQIQKEIGYWTEDGPHLGLDAPPGSFIFPKPDDYSPPIISTPNPTPTDPTTGGWTIPPLIGGIQYVEPPGGMQGTTNPTVYNDYKCDVATFIYEYVLSWYDTILQKIDSVQNFLVVVDVLKFLVDVLKGNMVTKLPTAKVVYDVVSGITLKKAAEQTGMTLLTATEALTLGAFIVSGAVINWMLGISFSEYKNNLVATKQNFICALRKARTIGEAREGVMEALNENVWHIIDFGQGSGAQGLFIRTLLSDNLLANLFACDANLDPATIAGIGAGNCVDCLLCTDTEEEIAVNQSSQANYAGLIDKGDLVPYPITYNVGNITTDLICCVAETGWANGSGSIEVWVDGVKKCTGGWGAELKKQAVRLLPVSPDTLFSGDITLKMYHNGATIHGARLTLYSVGWRNATP